MRSVLVVAVLAVPLVAGAQRGRRSADPPAPPPAATPTPAPAPDVREQARALFADGQRAYTEGDYELAVAKWQEAYALDPARALQYNLAQAYGRLGDLEHELEALRRYVDGLPESDPQATLSRARITALENRLSRTGLAFTGLGADAELRIDGEVVANPAEGELVAREPGSHRIAVRRRGHRPFSSVVEVVAGRTATVAVEQDRIETVRPPILGYSLLAGGGAALATSLATGLLAWKRSPDEFAGTSDGDRVHRLALSSDILLGVGAAAAVTGLVLVIVHDPAESDGYDSAAVHVAPFATASSGGLVLDGRF